MVRIFPAIPRPDMLRGNGGGPCHDAAGLVLHHVFRSTWRRSVDGAASDAAPDLERNGQRARRLYRLHPVGAPHVGDLIALHLPERDADMLARGGYLPLGVPLLKPVAAVGGQTVCRSGSHITIDGRATGDALPVDHRHRPLPVWQGCHRLGVRELFVMNTHEPRA